MSSNILKNIEQKYKNGSACCANQMSRTRLKILSKNIKMNLLDVQIK